MLPCPGASGWDDTMHDAILQGFLQAIQPGCLLATAIGSLLGLIVGMLPGMTISAGIIIVLPLTFVLDPAISIALLLGLYSSHLPTNFILEALGV